MTCNKETSPRCLLLNRNALHSNQGSVKGTPRLARMGPLYLSTSLPTAVRQASSHCPDCWQQSSASFLRPKLKQQYKTPFLNHNSGLECNFWEHTSLFLEWLPLSVVALLFMCSENSLEIPFPRNEQALQGHVYRSSCLSHIWGDRSSDVSSTIRVSDQPQGPCRGYSSPVNVLPLTSKPRSLAKLLVVQSLSCVQLCDPMDPCQALWPSLSPEFAQIHIHWVSDAIQLSHPLPPPSPFAFNLSLYQGLFQLIGSLH